MMQRKVLLLDRNYFPMTVITWKRAIGMIYGRNNAEVITMYSDAVHEHEMAVLRLLYRDFPASLRKEIRYPKASKRKIMVRDGNQCVYCGAIKNLTIDHIIPKSKGGKNTYENCVTACYTCNNKKGSKTPEEAGMRLSHRPTRPRFGVGVSKQRAPEEWKDFLIF